MNLLIEKFPDDVRWKLRRMAMDSGVTLRELVITGLSRLAFGENGGGEKKREIGERIKGQMERLSGKGPAAVEDELKF